MSRVNLEESSFAAARKIGSRSKLHAHEVVGMLGSMWHESQILEATEGSYADLSEWLCFDKAGLDTETGYKFIEAMVECKLLAHPEEEKTNNLNWIISGNEKHIERLRALKKQSSDGGKASGLTRRSKPTLEAPASFSAKRTLEDNTVQHNTIQCSTVQFKKEEKEKFPNPSNSKTALTTQKGQLSEEEKLVDCVDNFSEEQKIDRALQAELEAHRNKYKTGESA